MNPPTAPASSPSHSIFHHAHLRLRVLIERLLPQSLIQDTELNRRANLLVGFGFMGAAFGIIFSILYTLIGHYWGALVVILCSTGMAFVPFTLKRTFSLNYAGNLITLILIVGFTVLCCLERGLQGHAIAWIISVPLCSLLLLSTQPMAFFWCIVSLVVTLVFVGIDFAGFRLTPSYPQKWEPLVSAAGFIALAIFMMLLGIIFEVNRRHAELRMVESLRKLERANADLARLNQEKTDFLNMAAHDIKNPLGVVVGYAEMIRDFPDLGPAETLSSLESIIQASSRMQELVTTLLNVQAIEEGRTNVTIQSCLLEKLAQTAVTTNAAVASRKGITVEFVPFPCGPISVEADPFAVQQILDNLVSNAVKFSRSGTTVLVKPQVVGTHGVVEIIDQGPGLSEEDQKKLFTKFARLSAKPTGNESSHGLGLSIVHRLAQAMAGSVYCSSSLGQGATFGLRLPLSQTGFDLTGGHC